MNDYKVTIMIESYEEIESMEFWVGANSFEEAVADVRKELDI